MRSYMIEVQNYFDKGELLSALNVLNEYLSVQKTDIGALNFRARIQYKLQNWGEAMNDYLAVLELEPENKEAKSGLQMARNILGYFTPDLYNP